MEIRSIAILALLGSTGLLACTDKGDDSSGGDESDADTDTDTDTDTDSDTDSDTDTDVHEPWHADTISIDFGFGWDATTNEIATATGPTGPLGNYVAISLFNLGKQKALDVYQFCFVSYDLPDGAVPMSSASGDYWMGFDLSKLTPTITGKTTDPTVEGDCEMMEDFIDVSRGTQTLEEFVMALGFGAHIGNFANVDEDTYDDWESFWDDSFGDKIGEWDDTEPYFSLAGFTTDVETFGATNSPAPFGVAFGYLVDEKWNLVEKDGAVVTLDLSAMAAPPTAYYQTQSLYIYGTGF